VLLKRSKEDLKLVEAKGLLSGPHMRRGRLSIIADILDVAKRGAIKISFLLDANLLKAVETEKKTIYKTTDKGLRYLQSYMEIGELLEK